MLHISNSDYGKVWEEYLAGNGEALEELMRVFYDLLYQYGMKLTGDRHLVQDGIQSLFLVLWNNRRNINPTASVTNYLLKALRNILRRELARIYKYASQEDSTYFGKHLSREASAETTMILKEESEQLASKVKKEIALLSPRQQEVVYLKFYLNLRSGEIAEIMDLNRQSVYNLLNDALNRLRAVSRMHFRSAFWK